MSQSLWSLLLFKLKELAFVSLSLVTMAMDPDNEPWLALNSPNEIDDEEPPAKRACTMESGLNRTRTMDLEEEDHEPNVLVELLQWPSMVASVLDDIFSFSLNLSSCLPHHFPREDDLSSSPAKTFYLTTHYTGLGTVEHCLKELQAARNSKSKVVLWSGHEIDTAARDLGMKSAHAPKHMFGDIMDQFSLDDYNLMQTTVKVLKERAHKLASQCSTREQKNMVFGEHSRRCMSKLCHMVKNFCKRGKVQTHGFCYVHNDFCPFFPSYLETEDENGIVIEAGGNSCVAFSPQGGQSRWLHPSAVVTAAWLGRTAFRRPHIVLQECSSLFNTTEAFNMFFPPEENWSTKVLKLKCSDVGIPMARLRNYSWTINTNRLHFLKKDIFHSEYLTVMRFPVLCSGHDFFCAPESMVQESLQKDALRLKHISNVKRLPMDAALSPGAKLRLQAYQDILDKAAGHVSPSKQQCGVVDISQNPSVRPFLSSSLPSLLTHLWSQYHKRGWLPKDDGVASDRSASPRLWKGKPMEPC